MRKGFAGYVLMSFDNFVYLTIEDGDLFGHVDMVLHKRALEIKINKRFKEGGADEKITHLNIKHDEKMELKRIFSVQSLVNSELVMLPINHLV